MKDRAHALELPGYVARVLLGRVGEHDEVGATSLSPMGRGFRNGGARRDDCQQYGKDFSHRPRVSETRIAAKKIVGLCVPALPMQTLEVERQSFQPAAIGQLFCRACERSG